MQNKQLILQRVFQIFNQIQQFPEKSINVKQVNDLIELLKNNCSHVICGMQQCFLKIMKQISRNPKKSAQRFQKFSESLFEILSKFLNDQVNIYQKKQNEKRKNNNINKKQIIKFFEHFMMFFSEGLQSNINTIQVFSAKLIFYIIKPLHPTPIYQINKQVLDFVTKNIVGLIRCQKQLFIKIASLLQYNSQQLRFQIKKMAHQQPNDNVRKLAISNLLVKDVNDISERLRDRNKQNRIISIKKLRKNQICLQGLMGWKILYDGISSRDQQVKKQFILYIVQRLNYNKPYLQKQKTRNSLCQSKEQSYIFKSKLLNFFKSFDIQQILFYPHLNRAITQIFTQVLFFFNQSQLIAYLNQIFGYFTKRDPTVILQQGSSQKKPFKSSLQNINSEDILIFKCFCIIMKNKSQQLGSQLKNYIEERTPGAKDLQLALLYFHQQGKLFHVYQLLQIIKYQINIDQGGRQKLRRLLKKILLEKSYYQKPICVRNNQQYNDVYYKIDKNILRMKILQQNNYQIKIIYNNLDLLSLMIQLFNKYSNQQYFQTQLCQISSQQLSSLYLSDDNQINLYKHKQLAKKKLKQLENNNCNDKLIIQMWKQRYDKILQKIQFTEIKGLTILTNIATQCFNPPLQIIESVKNILNYLNINSYSYSLALQTLGTFSLLNINIAKQYLNYFLKYFFLQNEQNFSIQNQFKQIISLKILSDLIQRYNILKSNSFSTLILSANQIMDRLIILMFMSNSQIRNQVIQIICKLIYNEKIPNDHIFFICLLLLWWDTKIHLDGNAKAVQLISVFFKTFPQKNEKNMQYIQNNFEIFFILMQMIKQKQLTFNKSIVDYKFDHKQMVQKSINICINILKNCKQTKYLSLFSMFLFQIYQQKYYQKNMHIFQKIDHNYKVAIKSKMYQILEKVKGKQKKQKYLKQLKKINDQQQQQKIILDCNLKIQEKKSKVNLILKTLIEKQIIIQRQQSYTSCQYIQQEEQFEGKRISPQIRSEGKDIFDFQKKKHNRQGEEIDCQKNT